MCPCRGGGGGGEVGPKTKVAQNQNQEPSLAFYWPGLATKFQGPISVKKNIVHFKLVISGAIYDFSFVLDHLN